MFTRGIIIFEGPDGVGKTTLINYIRKKYDNSYYMHLRVHKNMKLWHTASARLAIRKRLEGYIVLLDRHWPSEQFYSHIYREGPSYDPEEIYRRLKLEGALYVWCLPSDIEQVKQNIEEDRMAGKYKKGQMIVQGQWPNPDKWAKEYIIPNADGKGVRIYAKGASFKIEKL